MAAKGRLGHGFCLLSRGSRFVANGHVAIARWRRGRGSAGNRCGSGQYRIVNDDDFRDRDGTVFVDASDDGDNAADLQVAGHVEGVAQGYDGAIAEGDLVVENLGDHGRYRHARIPNFRFQQVKAHDQPGSIWSDARRNTHQVAYSDAVLDERLLVGDQGQAADDPGIDAIHCADKDNFQPTIIVQLLDAVGNPGSVGENTAVYPHQVFHLNVRRNQRARRDCKINPGHAPRIDALHRPGQAERRLLRRSQSDALRQPDVARRNMPLHAHNIAHNEVCINRRVGIDSDSHA